VKRKRVLIWIILAIFTLIMLNYTLLNQGNFVNFIELELTDINAKKNISDMTLTKELINLVTTKPYTTDYRESNRVINIHHNKFNDRFYYFDTTLFFPKNKALFILSPKLKDNFASYFAELINEYYGQYISWSEADILFQRNQNAFITDMETGLSFQVVRKAGSYHADVQPLTAKDTEIMKQIYGDNWSWKRRAIILTVGGKKIAASMNGMPHGAGSIKNNNFPGHFCVHFLESKVHKSRNVDLAHQLMIAKASGKIEEQIHQASPKKLIVIFFTALKQHDWNMAGLTLGYKNEKEKKAAFTKLKQFDDIKNFTIHKSDGEINEMWQLIPVSVIWKKRNNKDYTTTQLLLSLQKNALQGEWYIKAHSVLGK
jgi:hypothetical protein